MLKVIVLLLFTFNVIADNTIIIPKSSSMMYQFGGDTIIRSNDPNSRIKIHKFGNTTTITTKDKVIKCVSSGKFQQCK